jgi:hypothetical protein
MPQETDKMEPSHWMVQGAAVASGALFKHMQANPDVREIRRIAPDVVVLSMTEASAERLKMEFADLIVEPDADLYKLT